MLRNQHRNIAQLVNDQVQQWLQSVREEKEKKVTPEIPVPRVQIRDWPDTPNRMVRLEHPHTFRNYAVRENRGIDYLIDWTDRFVAGDKFNTLYIDLSANVRYERRPEFNGSEKICCRLTTMANGSTPTA